MTNKQLNELQNIRNAVDDLYGKLDIELYERINVLPKINAAKVTYNKVKPSDLITDNLRYIVEKINSLQEDGE